VTVRETWRRGQAGWPRAFPIVQLPNRPLLLAFAGRAVAAATDGPVRTAGRAAATVGLGVWAWEETTDGANWLRRAIGAGALAWLIARLRAGRA
jgi:hypothetical protein